MRKGLVVEYKGSQFAGSDDAKKRVDRTKVWAEVRNLLLMGWRNEWQGCDIHPTKLIQNY